MFLDRIHPVCEAFEAALRTGASPQIAEYLAGWEDTERADLFAYLLELELDYRSRSGGSLGVETYCEEFPEYTHLIGQMLEQTMVSAAQPAAGVSSTTAVPRRFGDYELLEEIARGGMGVVFKARQLGLNRLVALKMIRSGELADAAEIQRFYAEAEAAAQLDHPGIVPVYEVGQCDGRHFFSMAYIDGESLADRLKEGPLAPREAAALAQRIAEAVQYAHAQGVVHRDLKPANVLLQRVESPEFRVGSDEGQQSSTRQTLNSGPTTLNPRITDFGLAKRTQGDTELTASGQILGTPNYMPPEQAAGLNDEIGPLSDVYSLGAMLYCMLTGRPPFQAAGVMETLQQVLEREPVSPRQLNPGIARDLETICLKCLEKEPARRYRSSGDFAADVGRFLQGRPILARPVGRSARAWRWCKRNPLAASFAGGIALSLAAVAIVSSVAAIRLNRSARAEHAARLDAERNFSKARRAVDAMLTEVAEESLDDIPQMEPVRRRLLEQAVAFYRELLASDSADASLRAELGRAYVRTGQVYRLLGQPGQAERMYRQAVAIFHELLSEAPDDVELQHHKGVALQWLGELFRTSGVAERSEEFFRKALAVQQRVLTADSVNGEYRREWTRTHNNYGILLGRLGRNAEAERTYAVAIDGLKRLHREHPDNSDYAGDLARAHLNLGVLLKPSPGRFRDALTHYRRAVELSQELVQAHPHAREYRYKLAAARLDLGNLLLGNTAGRSRALPEIQAAVELLDRLIADFPGIPRYRREAANSRNSLVNALALAGRNADALREAEAAVKLLEVATARFPEIVRSSAEFNSVYGITLGGLAYLLHVEQDFDGAAARAAEASNRQRTAVKLNPGSTQYRGYLKQHLLFLVKVHLDRKQPQSAVEVLKQARTANELTTADLEGNKSLEPLRQRMDFRALLSSKAE